MAVISFNDILSGADKVVQTVLQDVYPHMAASLSETIYIVAIVYWAVFGLRIYAGYEAIRWDMFLSRTVMTVAVFSVLSWGSLAGQIYGFFTSLMDGIVTMAARHDETVTQINVLWNNVGHVSASMMKVNSFQQGLMFQGYGLFLLNILLFAITLVYLVMAKMGLAITMLLLPVFVAFFLFEQTRQWAMNWISVMLHFCFVYVLVFLVLRIGLMTFTDVIAETDKIAAGFNNIGTPKLMKGQVQNVAYLYLVESILILFMLQVRSWAAALSRGSFTHARQAVVHLMQVLPRRKAD